jgi:hypothetical protein
LILTANQAGGPGSAVSWSLTATSNLNEIPLPPAIFLFGTALGGLVLLGWLNKRKLGPAVQRWLNNQHRIISGCDRLG